MKTNIVVLDYSNKNVKQAKPRRFKQPQFIYLIWMQL